MRYIDLPMLIGQYNDYKSFLRDELIKRIQSNPKYSLRAFARDLKIAPQNLSSTLKGKRGLSQAIAAQISVSLNLSNDEASYFCDLVDLQHARTSRRKELVEQRLARFQPSFKYRVLQEDAFHLIADWYHYAIFELIAVPGFEENPRWIAKRLDISIHEATQALERLIRLGLFKREGNRLVRTENNIATTTDIPSTAVRKLAKQLLSKAQEAIDKQDIKTRDVGSMTMAISTEKIPEAKDMIRKFRRRLAKFLETDERRTEVYCFSTQLFRMSVPNELKGNKK